MSHIFRNEKSFWTKDRFDISLRDAFRKYKSRKSRRLIKRQFRKPSYTKIALPRLIFFMFVGVIILGVIVYTKYESYMDVFDEEFSHYSSYTGEAAENAYASIYEDKGEEKEQLIEELNGGSLTDRQKEIQYNLALEDIYNRYNVKSSYELDHYIIWEAAIYNTDTSLEVVPLADNEIIIDMYNSMESNDDGRKRSWSEHLRFVCRDEQVARQMDAVRERRESSKYESYYTVGVKGIYVKDDYTFVPDEMVVMYTENSEKVWGQTHLYPVTEEIPIKCEVGTREEMEEQGYRYLEPDRNAYKVWFLYPRSASDKELFNKINADNYSSGGVYFPLTPLYTSTAETIVEKEDGCTDNYKIITICRGDFLNTYDYSFSSTWGKDATNKEMHICYASIIFVIAIAISLFSSYITYNNRVRIYEMNRFRQSLTNVMAHDLKTPLTSLRGSAENLEDMMKSMNRDSKECAGDEFVKYSGNIIRNADYMNELINKTLTLSKLESGDPMLEKQEVSVRDLIHKAVQRNSDLMDSKDLSLEIEGDDIVVNGDEFWLGEAFNNLIENATKYSPEKSKITITLEKRILSIKNETRIIETTSGKEIAKPFVKNDKARGGRSGSGLGLSLVRNIIEIHGWTMKVIPRSNEFCVFLKCS